MCPSCSDVLLSEIARYLAVVGRKPHPGPNMALDIFQGRALGAEVLRSLTALLGCLCGLLEAPPRLGPSSRFLSIAPFPRFATLATQNVALFFCFCAFLSFALPPVFAIAPFCLLLTGSSDAR